VNRIITYGSQELRKKSEEVKNIDSGIQRVFDDMIDTMYAGKGIGLSAIQIGIPLRMVIVNVSGRKEDLICLVNPEIQSRTGRDVFKEGCLSIPGVFAEIKRPAEIVVKGMDRRGNKLTIKADGLSARALQHEIDHLDGKLFIDYLSIFKRIAVYLKLYRIKHDG